MHKILAITAAIAASVLLANPVQAQSRCPANATGCTLDNFAPKITGRVLEGAKAVVTNKNSVGRVKEATETAKDCLNCGMDAARDGMDRIKPR